MSKPADWQAANAAIQAAQRILIVTHLSPDGDAIGSALGLGNALSHMGKDVTIAADDGVPEYLQWLPHASQIIRKLSIGSWDVMISTDASDEERTGEVGAYGRANSAKVINLDHHVTNTYFGDIHLVVTEAVSATEIVFDWWQHLGIKWTRDVAVPLLTGLVTDTIGFRTSNVKAQTLGVAQVLMECGASLTEITARVLDSRSYQDLSLWKRVLPSVELHGQVIEATIRYADLQSLNLEDATTAGLVSFLNQTQEAMVSVVFLEESPESIKLSLRAKTGYDVSQVALALGGGGHKQASGATVAGDIDTVREKVLPLLQAVAAKGTLSIV